MFGAFNEGTGGRYKLQEGDVSKLEGEVVYTVQSFENFSQKIQR